MATEPGLNVGQYNELGGGELNRRFSRLEKRNHAPRSRLLQASKSFEIGKHLRDNKDGKEEETNLCTSAWATEDHLCGTYTQADIHVNNGHAQTSSTFITNDNTQEAHEYR